MGSLAGLDLVNFDIVEVLPQRRGLEPIIMRDKRQGAYYPWCVQYAGNGHYFFSRPELEAYCRQRKWRVPA